MAVSLEELMVSFGADTAGFERGAKRVEDKLKEVASEAEKTGNKLNFGDKIKAGFSSLQSTFQTIGSNLANIKAGLDIAKDIGGFFFDMAKGAAEAGSKFHDLSLQTGVSVETFSGLQLQLKQSNTDMDALARAAVFLQKNLGEAASGNKELQRAFASLGIKDVRAGLADTDGSLRTVIKSLGEMKTAGERNAAGSKVMGKGFKELSVFIADTGGNLDEVIEQSRNAGRVMTDEAANAADAFGDELDALTNAASVASRNFAMGFVPAITDGMRDVTGALQTNAGEWRQWGEQVGDAIRGAMTIASKLKGLMESDAWKNFGPSEQFLRIANPIYGAYQQLKDVGAEAKQRQLSDPAYAARAVAEIDAAQGLGMAKSLMGPAKGSVSDFFDEGPGKAKKGKSAAEKEAERQAGVLKSLAQAAQEAGLKVKFFGDSEAELEVAQKRLTSGIETLTGGIRAQAEVQFSLWATGVRDLEVKQKLADAKAEEKRLADATTDAYSHARDMLGELTGAERTHLEEVQAFIVTSLRQGVVLDANTEKILRMVAAAEDATNAFQKWSDMAPVGNVNFPGPVGEGPTVDSSGMGPAPSVHLFDGQIFREQLREMTNRMGDLKAIWRDGMLNMAQDGQQILGRFFLDLGHGFKDATLSMLASFGNMLAEMAAQAAASAIWSNILNIAGSALGGALSGGIGGGSHGGGGFSAGGKFGFATGGSFLVGGSGGTDKTPVSFMATRGERVTIETPGQQRAGGGGVIINYHITAPAGNIPRETQAQMARRTTRALEAARNRGY